MIEYKSNIADSILQLVRLGIKENINYVKVCVVREAFDNNTYDVEVMTPDFDFNKSNLNNYMYGISNVTDKTINAGCIVYLTQVAKNIYIIFAADDVNNINILSSDTVIMSGQTFTGKFEVEYKFTTKDDELLIDLKPEDLQISVKNVGITSDTISMESSKGGTIVIEDKISIENQITSLKDLFSDLVSALNTNVVPDCTLVAPYGASTGAALAAALTQLTTKINGLLK